MEKFETKNVLLLKGQTYLFPCLSLSLAKDFRACLSPKSSIGRIDVLVRAVFDELGLYDTIPYTMISTGELWLEVSPQSFNIRVSEGICLTQMMLFKREESSIPQSSTKSLIQAYDIVFNKRTNNRLRKQFHRQKLILSLDVRLLVYYILKLSNELVGYQALVTNAVIDLSKIKKHEVSQFFRPISRVRNSKEPITLEKDQFYILSTKERISIPTCFSAEMVPFSQNIGELRAHYAGFFDPGFGYGTEGEVKGIVGVLEVRPHETITIYDGQPICLMEFFPNFQMPEKHYGSANNNYHNQIGPKLAKFFLEE